MKLMATGGLRKMRSRLQSPVSYQLPVGETLIELNALLDKPLRLHHSGRIHCVHCGRQTNKSFNQGYCYPCFQSLAQCDSCIIHPERCHYDKGTCREPTWGEQFCMHDHIVYLANSSGLKVGITRATQVPTRWIDQGAVQALPVARVRSRLQSGALEVLFKQHVADKTNWRDMLRNNNPALDLEQEKQRLFENCKSDIADLQQRFGFHAISLLGSLPGVDIHYPVLEYPQKITTLNFDKQPTVEGVLRGIKGQYLILDSGVINMRRFGGYEIEVAA